MSVRGRGHSVAGNAVCDGGLTIDLSRMRSVHIDPDARRAYVEPGATLRDLDHEAQAFGLATPVGINSTTGVAGLTLGGGIGWLTRKHGLTVDNLVAAELVTAEAEARRVNRKDTARPGVTAAVNAVEHEFVGAVGITIDAPIHAAVAMRFAGHGGRSMPCGPAIQGSNTRAPVAASAAGIGVDRIGRAVEGDHRHSTSAATRGRAQATEGGDALWHRAGDLRGEPGAAREARRVDARRVNADPLDRVVEEIAHKARIIGSPPIGRHVPGISAPRYGNHRNAMASGTPFKSSRAIPST
jgi:hypothetical protein